MRTVKLGRLVSPALKELRYVKAVIVGIIDATLVLIQKKGEEREICPAVNLYLEEDVFDIDGMTQEEIDKLIPENGSVENTTTDFDRFKVRLLEKIERDVLHEKMQEMHD